MSELYRYFKENMDALGLAAPETLFANATTALATATALATQIDKFGSRVTVMEIIDSDHPGKMLDRHWQQTA